MSLKTYDRVFNDVTDKFELWPYTVIGGCGDLGCVELKPGDWITHHRNGGRGMIVAITCDQMSVLWSEEPSSGFEKFAFPMVRRTFTPLIAQQLVSVQPMTAPAGSIFYLDYVYQSEETKRCNEGPWHGRMYWRTKRWLKTKTSQLSSSWSSFWRSRFVRKLPLSEPLQLKTPLPQSAVVEAIVKEWEKRNAPR